MNLHEWTKQYVKFKDAMKKLITSVEEKEDRIIVHQKTTDLTYVLQPTLTSPEENTITVCFNSKENIEFIIKKFDTLKTKQVTFILVNLDANEKWLLHPKTHANITEPESVAQGLKTLYSSVGEYRGH
jgi:fructose-1-phosphate kinase PfkB-like protein